MKSGGYLHFADIEFPARCDDGTIPDDAIWNKWAQTANAFWTISNRRFFNAEETKQGIKDAGFVEIVEKRYKLPIGAWSSDAKYREIGRVRRSPLQPPGMT
jgi:hypothetical protein